MRGQDPYGVFAPLPVYCAGVDELECPGGMNLSSFNFVAIVLIIIGALALIVFLLGHVATNLGYRPSSLYPHPRIAREMKTLNIIIATFCEYSHPSLPKNENHLCVGCTELLAFAYSRLDRCPFRHEKPACARCYLHCYRCDLPKQALIRRAMRIGGPRLLLRHPVLFLLHLADALRPPTRGIPLRVVCRQVAEHALSERSDSDGSASESDCTATGNKDRFSW